MRHEFAFYTPQASLIATKYTITDKVTFDAKLYGDMVQRATQIVRVQPGDTIIIFDEQMVIRLQVTEVTKKHSFSAIISSKVVPEALKPTIQWIVPLLEREPFEEALAYLTILGATTIYPVITDKVHRTEVSLREWERIRRLMIAAAEQSKQFVFPVLQPITSLAVLLEKNIQSPALFFDAQGCPSQTVITSSAVLTTTSSITCMIGPEGDLTTGEKELLRKHGFQFCALTPSILRSQHAIMVGMGMLRSLFNT